MAGVVDEVDLEDAMGIMAMMVAVGRVPAPAAWVHNVAEIQGATINEAFAESFF